MAPEKEGRRTQRKGSAGRSEGKRGEQAAEKDAARASLTMVDVDPWGSFFEKFWGQPGEGESVDRHAGGRRPTKGARSTGTKPGRRGRSSRAS
jgi:hypothetical protein